MRVFTSVVPVRVLSVFAVLAVLCVAPMGCGESAPPTGTTVKEVPEIKQANNAMLESVKAKSQEKAADKK